MQELSHQSRPVLTIGHSNHSLEYFLNLLKMHSVEVVADTRSYPYSDYAPHFDREPLRKKLGEMGLKYVDLGQELGGRPKGSEFYDSKGHVLYDRVAATPAFQDGLARLENGIHTYSIAILCSEENPAICHRKVLIGKVLTERGFSVEHIRGDGRVQSDAEVSAFAAPSNIQQELFAEAKAQPWKSIPSVLRKKRQNSSSAH